MKTLDEILTMCGDKWLLLSQKDKHGQMVHKVDVATLQRCEGGSGPTFASGSSVAMFDSDIIDLVQKRGSSHKCMHDSGMISPITRRPKDEE